MLEIVKIFLQITIECMTMHLDFPQMNWGKNS